MGNTAGGWPIGRGAIAKRFCAAPIAGEPSHEKTRIFEISGRTFSTLSEKEPVAAIFQFRNSCFLNGRPWFDCISLVENVWLTAWVGL